jgi:hypothetical protein
MCNTALLDPKVCDSGVLLMKCKVHDVVTCGPIARERIDKHIYMEVDSWRQLGFETCFRVNEHSTNIS